MPRFAIEMAFNGANYHGWQVQPNAHSVQAELNRALSLIFRQTVETVGAGRTDTGVHASCYVAHFDLECEPDKTPEKVVYQLNAVLPADVVAYRLLRVDNRFHARFDAVSRAYTYLVTNHKTPFLNQYSYFVPELPDVGRMNQACALLMEVTDFASFSKLHSDNKTTLCRLMQCNWQVEGKFLIFRVEADRFLRNMVRALAGTLLDVGRGKLSMADLKTIAEARDRRSAGLSVPSQGLFLSGIRYPLHDFCQERIIWPNF